MRTTITARPRLFLCRRKIDIGPDQHDRPQREAEEHRDPAGDGDRLRPRMIALLAIYPGSMARNTITATVLSARMIRTIQANRSIMSARRLALSARAKSYRSEAT
jgi:hypothetical protein